ncbi:hypothetical protein ASF92_12405 [Pedobacter sp. Leaf176]|nr:hypothetical protein ASF92_12405 [Pedobacter sp. Leaf176]
MKNREERAALGSSKLNVIAQALTFFTSIISYADSEVQIAWCRDRPDVKVFFNSEGNSPPFFKEGQGWLIMEFKYYQNSSFPRRRES